MSPVFIANPTRITPQFDSSSMPPIALNNTQIRTLINIFPPNPTSLSPSFPPNPIDLRKHHHHPSTMATHALYQFYFPHLFALQNHQPTHPLPDRGVKRSALSEGKLTLQSILFFICGLFEESFPIHKRTKCNPSQKRFDFAKLADEAVKDKEENSASCSSPRSLDVSSNKIDLSVSSSSSPPSAPAAITSGVSLLASNRTSYVLRNVFVYLFVWTSGAKISRGVAGVVVVIINILISITRVCEERRRRGI